MENTILVPVDGFDVTPVGLVIGNVDYETWAAMGMQLQRSLKVLPFLLGDWLNHGEREYGETYTQAIDLFDYSLQTMTNYKWVCDRVPIEVRRPNLSFSHHAVVARFADTDVQELWLDKAEANDWNRDELRAAIQGDENILPAPRLDKERLRSLLWETRTSLQEQDTTRALETLDICLEML